MSKAVVYISFLPIFAVIAAVVYFRRHASRLRLASPPDARVIRSADLSQPGTGNAGWWLALAATGLPLGMAALVLRMRWQDIPARFPIHWGLSGQPDRWVDRTPSTVYGLLLVAVVLVLSMGMLGEVMARLSPGFKGRASMMTTVRIALGAAAWLLTMLFSGVSLLPLTTDPTKLVPWIALAAVLFSVGLAGFLVYRVNRNPETLVAAMQTTDARFWKAGLIYFNPADSAWMVPKRSGLGYTLNFGQPVCWVLLGLVLVLPLLVLFVMQAGQHR